MNIIYVYTDGSCPHQTKHMGIGIYVKYKDKEIKFSKYVGMGTNNIAELTAIKVALQKLKQYQNHRIKIITDSKYCIGVITNKYWKPKKNTKLIKKIKRLLKQYKDLSFEWVKGHDESYGNKQADKLALESRKNGEKKYPTGYLYIKPYKTKDEVAAGRGTFVYKTKHWTPEEIAKENENNRK